MATGIKVNDYVLLSNAKKEDWQFVPRPETTPDLTSLPISQHYFHASFNGIRHSQMLDPTFIQLFPITHGRHKFWLYS